MTESVVIPGSADSARYLLLPAPPYGTNPATGSGGRERSVNAERALELFGSWTTLGPALSACLRNAILRRRVRFVARDAWKNTARPPRESHLGAPMVVCGTLSPGRAFSHMNFVCVLGTCGVPARDTVSVSAREKKYKN